MTILKKIDKKLTIVVIDRYDALSTKIAVCKDLCRRLKNGIQHGNGTGVERDGCSS